MDRANQRERGAQFSFLRSIFLLIPATLACCLLFPSAALPNDEKEKQRPANYEHVSGATCIVREENKTGTMPGFHVYLALDYEDGTTWSTQEAIVPIDYSQTSSLKERWQMRIKARNKAYKFCDRWDLEVAQELDKVQKLKAQKDSAPVQRASKD